MVRKRPQTIPGQPSTQKDKAGTDQMPCARLSKVQSRHELRDPGQPSRTSRGAGLTGTPVPRARQRARVHPRCYGCWYPHPVNHELLQPRAACGPSSSPRAAASLAWATPSLHRGQSLSWPPCLHSCPQGNLRTCPRTHSHPTSPH